MISEVFDGKWIKPYVTMYLLFLGVLILLKSFRSQRPKTEIKFVSLLGAFGGFFDSIGGGGGGPIVTSNIVNQGNDPREAVGTVNTAEFFVAFCSTLVFLVFVVVESWQVVFGLIAGGLLAAPLGRYAGAEDQCKSIDVSSGDHHHSFTNVYPVYLVVFNQTKKIHSKRGEFF